MTQNGNQLFFVFVFFSKNSKLSIQVMVSLSLSLSLHLSFESRCPGFHILLTLFTYHNSSKSLTLSLCLLTYHPRLRFTFSNKTHQQSRFSLSRDYKRSRFAQTRSRLIGRHKVSTDTQHFFFVLERTH